MGTVSWVHCLGVETLAVDVRILHHGRGRSRHVLFDAPFFEESLGLFSYELRAVVGDNRLGYAKSENDVLPDKSGNVVFFVGVEGFSFDP